MLFFFFFASSADALSGCRLHSTLLFSARPLWTYKARPNAGVPRSLCYSLSSCAPSPLLRPVSLSQCSNKIKNKNNNNFYARTSESRPQISGHYCVIIIVVVSARASVFFCFSILFFIDWLICHSKFNNKKNITTMTRRMSWRLTVRNAS